MWELNSLHSQYIGFTSAQNWLGYSHACNFCNGVSLFQRFFIAMCDDDDDEDLLMAKMFVLLRFIFDISSASRKIPVILGQQVCRPGQGYIVESWLFSTTHACPSCQVPNQIKAMRNERFSYTFSSRVLLQQISSGWRALLHDAWFLLLLRFGNNNSCFTFIISFSMAFLSHFKTSKSKESEMVGN